MPTKIRKNRSGRRKEAMKMEYQYDDGGRALAGYKGNAGDCVARSVAIAMQLPYSDVYKDLSSGCKSQRGKKLSSCRDGVFVRRKWFKDFMISKGWKWTPTMGIGTGCKVHLAAGELPTGRLIVAVSKHMVAVVDGVIRDTFDPSRDGTRCVYGYWSKA